MLTQWYDPETGPAALPAIYAREFVSQGHEVRVLTGYPNYPTGKIYPGYKVRTLTREVLDGVTVSRVPLVPSHSRSVPGRILNYASFSLSASLLSRGALQNVDAIWVYNSPVSVALPMLVHSKNGRVPVFLHVQDLWPDSLVESGMFTDRRAAAHLTRAVSGIVRLMERKSAIVGVISPSVRELILERNDRIDPERIVYVPNPTNETLFRPARLIREQEGADLPDSSFQILYAGAIGDVQGFETLIEAAVMLRARTDIKFLLAGDGIKKRALEERVRALGLRNIAFLGRVPQSEIPSLMAQSHLHLVSLASNEFLRHTTPSKISTLLASEVPILAQLEGDGARMIKDSGAGLVVAPGDAGAFASAVLNLADGPRECLDQMAKAGRVFYERNLSATSAATKIVESLSCVNL